MYLWFTVTSIVNDTKNENTNGAENAISIQRFTPFTSAKAANSTRKPEFAAGLSSMAPQDSSPAVTAAIIFPKIMYLNWGSAV